MHRIRLKPLLAAILLVCPGLAKAQLVARVEQVGDMPRPLQAVRLRITISNEGNRPSEPIVPEQFGIAFIEINGRNLDRTVGSFYPVDRRAPARGEGEYSPKLVVLDPGGSVSVSFALQAHWWRRFQPLLTDTRGCTVCFAYTTASGTIKTDPYTVRVLEATGTDAEVLGRLRKRPEMIRYLLSPFESPPEEMLEDLREIAVTFGDSSYAPYARHALGRFPIGGARPTKNVTDEQKAAALEQLEAIDLADYPLAPEVLLMKQRLIDPKDARYAAVQVLLSSQYSDTLAVRRHAEE